MSMTMREIVTLLHAGEVPPKPINGKGERYSASTVKQIDPESGGCERRHWFEQVVGIEPPVRPALGRRTRVHGHVERALKKGTRLDPSPNAPMEERLAARGLPHLPPHGTPGMHVEREFKMGTWPGGPEFTGTIDLMVEPEGWADAEATGNDAAPFESAELLDHKTTGSYQKYAAKGWALSERTPENEKSKARKFLDDDIQNIAYSVRLLRWFDIEFVKSGWVYYSKDFTPVIVVRAKMEREPTMVKWKERIIPLVEKMQHQHKQRPSLATVEANEEACGNYGGCPHRAYCVDYKGTGARTTMGKLSAKLLEDDGDAPVVKSKKETKEEAPAMNPPATAKGASPFATMDKDEKPAKAAKKGSLADSLDDEPAATKSSKTSEPASKPAPATTAAPTGETKATSAKTAPSGAGFALFLGCEPVESKRPRVYFTNIIEPITARVAAAHKVEHIGLVKFDGVNHTCAALAEWLEENGGELDGTNVVVGRSNFHQDVAERVLYTKAIAVAKALS